MFEINTFRHSLDEACLHDDLASVIHLHRVVRLEDFEFTSRAKLVVSDASIEVARYIHENIGLSQDHFPPDAISDLWYYVQTGDDDRHLEMLRYLRDTVGIAVA